MAGVIGGVGGVARVTDKRLVWSPPAENVECARPASVSLADWHDETVLACIFIGTESLCTLGTALVIHTSTA